MNISRRKFIEAAPVIAGAILGLKGVVAGQRTDKHTGLFAIPEITATDPLSLLSWGSFYPFQGTEFVFSGIGVNNSLVLESMVDTKPKNLERISVKKGECFMLKFTDSARVPMKEGTYDVSHFRLGDFKLFITRGGQVKRKNYYIAVINRLVS